MKNKTPFLDFYKKCMKVGRLPKEGLCPSFKYSDDLPLFSKAHPDYGFDWYWGYGEVYDWHIMTHSDRETIMHEFTPLRQTIVLFCAAINNEL